ncbi:MAG: hypothetical protein H0X24_04850 [Ktedonobacterales bacterium]|nr:hypothetical protein [Ktedonobacterales bacterium]
MPTTHTSPRDMEMARRVRRMLIEQSCVLQEESPDEFTWLTRHFEQEERFFEDELGAHIEMRLGRWARASWPSPPRNRELCIADVFELTARKQTAYACLIRAFRSVRLLEGGENASVFRFAELFRYVTDEGTRLSPWLSFDEATIAAALAAQPDPDEELDDEEAVAAATTKPRARKAATGATATASRTAGTRTNAGVAQRARMNQRALYQAFQSFERLRLIRRLGSDERQRPEEQFRLDERDYGGLYEFTDLIDRFLPPSGLVQYDEVAASEGPGEG